ncbi:MAG: B-box zinc finger protein [Anaerolineae bacterium]
MTEDLHYCTVHPDRETELRCISCDRYMCVQCAIRTPVGYRCRECVRGQQAVFFKANPADDIIAGAICFVLMAIAAGIVSALPFGIWLGLIAGLPAGGAISEVSLRATKRRRSRSSHIVTAIAAVAGGFVGTFASYIINMGPGFGAMVQELGLGTTLQVISSAFGYGSIGVLIFVGIATAAIFGRYRMKM